MKKLLLPLGFVVLIFLNSCSVYKAVNQPGKKDLTVLKTGTPRDEVIAELGKPIHSEGSATKKLDVFSFVQGYSKGAKTGRALLHGAADLFTIGLWEVVGTPVENVADGTDVKVEVGYDSKQRVQKVTPFKGGELLQTQ